MQPLHLKFGEVSNKIPSLTSWVCVCFEYTFVNSIRKKSFASAAPVMSGKNCLVVNITSWDRL